MNLDPDFVPSVLLMFKVMISSKTGCRESRAVNGKIRLDALKTEATRCLNDSSVFWEMVS